MAHCQYIDEMIKEYLLFRGFTTTLKAFDQDLKHDKEKSFRVDKIIDQIWHYINTYDLNGLRELWNHFDTHLFAKLESNFTPGVRKLENGVLKLYLVNAVINNKPDRLNEFFHKMTPELQVQSEWKDWFSLPYTKNPEEHPTFALFFTKHWQDTLMLSLHNFLATIFHVMPKPTLLSYEDDAEKIRRLQERNESLQSRLQILLDKGPEANLKPPQVEPPLPVLDDFYVIAQESTSQESQAKSFRNLIRSMSSTASPILGRKDNTGAKKKTTGGASSASRTFRSATSIFRDS